MSDSFKLKGKCDSVMVSKARFTKINVGLGLNYHKKVILKFPAKVIINNKIMINALVGSEINYEILNKNIYFKQFLKRKSP